jgi:rod shape determining protein RodA
MVRQSSFFGFDLVLLGLTVFLMVVGVIFIYSSNVSVSGEVQSRDYVRQIIWVVSGLMILLSFSLVNYNQLNTLSLFIYAACIVLLTITLLFGAVVNGARSWLGIGSLGVQPSEFAKIGTILLLASFLSGAGRRIEQFRYMGLAAVIVALPAGLVLLQPDMGTALVYIPIFLAMAYMGGAKVSHLAFLLGSAALMVVLAVAPAYETLILDRDYSSLGILSQWEKMRFFVMALVLVASASGIGLYFFRRRHFRWLVYVSLMLLVGVVGSFAAHAVLREYQLMRLIIFMDPYVDPRGAGWNIIQSTTAIGSGGITGKGLLLGTQSRYNYLPQQSTDFVFSILAEEWGFLGGVVVLAAFLLVMLRGLRILSYARDDFALLTGTGVITMIFFHVVVNIGMTMGIMPITGIPLPFLSLGGSSLWTASMGIGILLNIYLRRYRY